MEVEKKDRTARPQRSSRFEVIREKKQRPAEVEEHLGLDRARVQALGYALDGPRGAYTGRVRVVQVFYVNCKRGPCRELDVLDERVASIFLYGVDLPRAW